MVEEGTDDAGVVVVVAISVVAGAGGLERQVVGAGLPHGDRGSPVSVLTSVSVGSR